MLLLIHSFSSSFFFLSNFQILNIFVALFSETVRPRKMKLVITHVNNGWMYRVYQIRLLLLIRFFISSFFFLSNFQTIKFLSHFSLELWVLESWNAPYSFLYFFNFLSLQFSNNKIFFALLSGIVSPRKLKLGTHMYTAIKLLLPLIHPFFHFSFSPNFKD